MTNNLNPMTETMVGLSYFPAAWIDIFFGGPIAHLGYFRAEFVVHGGAGSPNGAIADLVALCQFLPGLQAAVGIAVGLSRAGYSGALAAGFTLVCHSADPLFALGISSYGDYVSQGALHGLKVVAVAVVAFFKAVWGHWRVTYARDGLRVTIMAIATCVVYLLVPSAWGQVGVIAIAGIAGRLLFSQRVVEHDPLPITVSHRAGVLLALAFFVLLIGLRVGRTDAKSNHGNGGFLLSCRITGVRRWSRCAAYCKPKWCPPAGSTMNPFSRVLGQLERFGPLFTFAAFLGAR
ncbi:chromate transporter [Klebsiella pneumoniae]|uniref:chromate transporter n=1 Tax=Klebsiella pneumoniae TaxID=573 RepID=UPI003D973901